MAQGSNMKIQWDKSSGNPYFRYKTGEKRTYCLVLRQCYSL